MADLIGSVLEAASGYWVGRLKQKGLLVLHSTMLAFSLICGIIFFVAYGLYYLIFPSPNLPVNFYYGLALISLILSIVIYLILVLILVEERWRSHTN